MPNNKGIAVVDPYATEYFSGVRRHPHTVLVHYGDNQSPRQGCGDNNCDGNCGLPALMLWAEWESWQPGQCPRWCKVSGSAVTIGAVAQDLRVVWQGEVEWLPLDVAKKVLRMWWR